MIYGYVSISSQNKFNSESLEEQRRIINQRYPSAEIIEEKYLVINDRPFLNDCIEKIRSGDTFVLCSLDRLASTIKDAVSIIENLQSKGARVNIIDMGMVDNTSAGKNIVRILNKVIDFEKSMVVERTQIGKSFAKQNKNFKEGRPSKFSDEKIKEALNMLKNNSYKDVELLTGISKSTLIRAKKKYEVEDYGSDTSSN